MEIGNMAQWASAVATTVAVLIALFKEPFVRWIRRPKLVAHIEAKRPYCVRTPNKETAPGELPWSGWRYFLRIFVENQGTARAEKVEVFLSRAWAQQSGGSLKELEPFTPMNLRWSYTDHNDPEIYADGISRHMKKLCDFAAISDPKTPSLQPLGAPQCRLSLRLEALPPSSEWLLPGKYEFEIIVAASNCKPTIQRIPLHLTGLWDDDPDVMLAHGIRFDIP
jgi:hypothetical protein